jgi:hypothetical protein
MFLRTAEEYQAIRDESQRFVTELNHRPPWNGPRGAILAAWEIRLDNGISLELANLFMWFTLAD